MSVNFDPLIVMNALLVLKLPYKLPDNSNKTICDDKNDCRGFAHLNCLFFILRGNILPDAGLYVILREVWGIWFSNFGQGVKILLNLPGNIRY